MNVFDKLKLYYEKSVATATETLKQITDLTNHINRLSQHLIRTKQKDKSGKRGLFKLVGKRNRLLKYLRQKNMPGSELL